MVGEVSQTTGLTDPPHMTHHLALELLGYAASAIIAVSLMMRSIVRLRWINLGGAIAFVVYGILIEAYPVAALNLVVVAVNVVHLVRLRRIDEEFTTVAMDPGDAFVAVFLDVHATDIARFQPGFRFAPDDAATVLTVLCDAVPAGMTILGPATDGRVAVALDYAAPAYRDLRVATHLYEHDADILLRRGITALCSAPGSDAHARYLERAGFTRVGDRYERRIGPVGDRPARHDHVR